LLNRVLLAFFSLGMPGSMYSGLGEFLAQWLGGKKSAGHKPYIVACMGTPHTATATLGSAAINSRPFRSVFTAIADVEQVPEAHRSYPLTEGFAPPNAKHTLVLDRQKLERTAIRRRIVHEIIAPHVVLALSATSGQAAAGQSAAFSAGHFKRAARHSR
jgi:hypothetical protein